MGAQICGEADDVRPALPRSQLVHLDPSPQPHILHSSQQVQSVVVGQQSESPAPSKTKDPAPSLSNQDANRLAGQLCKDSKLVKDIQQKLSRLVCTDEQMARLASIAVDALVRLQTEKEPPQQKKVVEKILSESSVVQRLKKSSSEEGSLVYFDILNMVNKEVKEQLSRGSESRIYHSIANVKKSQFVFTQFFYDKRKNAQSMGLSTQSVRHGFTGTKDMDEMVRMEEVAAVSRRMGEQSSILMAQMQQQTQQLTRMLKETPFKQQWNYDLSEKEVLEVAAIARKATELNNDGVLILLSHLRQSMDKLSQKGKKATEIEESMLKMVGQLGKKYPPGEGLDGHSEEVKQALASLEKKGKDKGEFSHDPTYLKGTGEERTKQIRESILHYASIAQKHQAKFEEMIRKTCLKLAASAITGLKLNPNKPNEKALMRIQEKIFFADEAYAGKVDPTGKMVEQILKEEETTYEQELAKLLMKKDKVTFSVSDMVRGKCTFTSIADIIQTVKDLKEYCSEQPGFNIIQVESRFTRKVPISDVSLKIVIDNEIVSELQLTLQTNAAAYHFAHIVYEVVRSKIFTKGKMVDNMFRENEERVNELVTRDLRLKGDLAVPADKHPAIRAAFAIEQDKTITWEQAVGSAISGNEELRRSSALKKAVKEEAGELMVAVSALQGRWNKQELRQIMQPTIEPEGLSLMTKAVAIQQMFLRLDIAADIKSGYYTDFCQYIQDLLNIDVQNFHNICKGSSKMHYYITQLGRTQLDNNTLTKKSNKVFQDSVTGRNQVEEHQLRLLTQLVDAMAYFQAKQVSEYSNQLMSLLKNEKQKPDYRRLIPSIRLRLFENSISNGEIDKELCKEFKELRQELIKKEDLLVEWQLWNTALNLIIGNKNKDKSALAKYKEGSQKAEDLSKINLISLSTAELATAHWLIAKQFDSLENSKEKQAANEACEKHLSHVVNCGMPPRMTVKFKCADIISRFPKLKEAIAANKTLPHLIFKEHKTLCEQLKNLRFGNWPNLVTISLSIESPKQRVAQLEMRAANG